MTCFVDQQRHRLEVRFRKLCRSIVQLGKESCSIAREKDGCGNAPRKACQSAERTTSRQRSSGIRKSHATGISPTLSSVCTEIPPTILGGSDRGHSAFRMALDEAKEKLADVRRGERFRTTTESGNAILPAWRTRLSVHDDSGNVSISYKEIDQSLEGRGAPEKSISSTAQIRVNKGVKRGMCEFDYNISATRNRREKNKTGYPAGSKDARLSSHPKESCHKQSGENKASSDNAPRASRASTKISHQARGNSDERIGRGTVSPRRAKIVYVEAKRYDPKGKAVEVHVKLKDGGGSEGSTADNSTSRKVRNTSIARNGRGRNHQNANSSPGRHVKVAHIRSAPLHHALRTDISEENPTTNRHDSKQTSVASGEYACSRLNFDGCAPLQQWQQVNGARDNGRLFHRWREQQSAAAVRKETAGAGGRSSWLRERHRADGQRCSDHNYREVMTKEAEKDAAHEEGRRHDDNCKERNPQFYDKIRAEEKEEDAEGQRRWRRRGRVLWSTHAEPAARTISSGSRLVAQQTIRSRSQSPVRPYHGLYARSLQANGIDPANFRASPCRCGCDAGMSCAARHIIVDGSLLWRGHCGGDSLGAQRPRAPTDGLSDRLEAGRVLDSLTRRAELLGTMPPTLLRTKAAWMEKPGDPSYM